MERRGFLRGILAAGMAPAVVKAGVLMPLGKIWTPVSGLIYDPINDMWAKSSNIDMRYFQQVAVSMTSFESKYTRRMPEILCASMEKQARIFMSIPFG